jgi:hypothetical protein
LKTDQLVQVFELEYGVGDRKAQIGYLNAAN